MYGWTGAQCHARPPRAPSSPSPACTRAGTMTGRSSGPSTSRLATPCGARSPWSSSSNSWSAGGHCWRKTTWSGRVLLQAIPTGSVCRAGNATRSLVITPWRMRRRNCMNGRRCWRSTTWRTAIGARTTAWWAMSMAGTMPRFLSASKVRIYQTGRFF